MFNFALPLNLTSMGFSPTLLGAAEVKLLSLTAMLCRGELHPYNGIIKQN